jgi:CubicO group peptidase (beta-lactamase class C family)
MKTTLRFAVLLSVLAILLPRAGADDAPPKTVAAALQPFVDRHALAGAVALVADKDKVLGVNTVGFADIAGQAPMKPDTLFWIASMSKPITATALMMLVDEGKVKLDDPVEKYLPEFKDVWLAVEKDKEHMLLKRPAKSITVRHLLSHTSGLPFASAMEQPALDQLTLRDAATSYAMTPLQSEPGTKYAYSNAGINTAGRIIEVVSGMPYEEFLNKRLFEPLGMKDTTFLPSAGQLKRLATAYKPNKDKSDLEETKIGQLTYPLGDRKRQPMPAGGLFSTAADLGVFCQMLLNGGTRGQVRYLSEAAVRELTTKQTGDGVPNAYGLGFDVGGGRFGHGGAYATNMSVDPKTGLITIFLVQHAGWIKDGDQSLGAFRKAAQAQFGNPRE